MKIVKNEPLIKRNVKMGQWTSLGGILLMAGAMYGVFASEKRPELMTPTLIAMAAGFILTFVSSHLGNRFGGSPRLDESVDASLKGLPGDYTIYHFMSPAAHLLVGPAGIWVLLPYRQAGKIMYYKNRWRLSVGGFARTYMRFFGQDRLGRPEAEAASEIKDVQKELAKHLDPSEIPPINAVLVFYHNEAEIDPGDAPTPAMKSKQLKDFLRQRARENPITAEQIQKIKDVLE
jgi:hypothetical protein